MAEKHSQNSRYRRQMVGSVKENSRRAHSLNMRKPAPEGIELKRNVTPSKGFYEEKILNTEDDCDIFFEVCDSFKKALKKLSSSGNSYRIYEKLTEIRVLIEEKISFVKTSDSFDSLKSASLNGSNWSLSGQNLCFEKSHDLEKENGARFEEFMTAVNCPFCFEIQSDKISFVKHLDESCVPHLKRELKRKDHLPYATFQILPNNTFKCNICSNAVQQNLRNFFVHMQSEFHVQAYIKASKHRNYDKCLFCSCCKVLVYNSYLQISCHINNEIHKAKCASRKNVKYLLSKGIHCIFTDNYKFKCLKCPSASAMCSTPREVLDHFDGTKHKKLGNLADIYCEVCSEEVQMYKILNHFNSSQHSANEKNQMEKNFEICFFCNFFCESLKELSLHMKSECDEINKMRQKVSKESEPKEETGIEASIIKGPSITIKNCSEIPELFKYFRKFGEIVAIESPNDKDVVIEFREKSTVDDIALLRDVITVGGIKLDIDIDLRGGKSNEKVHEKEPESKVSDSDSKDEDSTDEDSTEVMIQDEQLDKLFRKVSSHLMNTSQMLNSTQEEKIMSDCIETLKVENCCFVGFSGSGLSFPSESLNLFCSSEGTIFTNSMNTYFPTLNNTQAFTTNLLKSSCAKLQDSKLWSNVECPITQGPSSCLRCVHKETQRTCIITFTKSASVLTNMLRECIEKSQLVKPFCLIFRFWLSVHELKIQNCQLALISLLVFFLINTNVVTLSEEKYKDCGVQSFLAAENIEVIRPSPQSKRPIANVKELFQKFLRFLNTFDFHRWAIYLPLRCAIPKSVLSQKKFKLLSGIENTDKLKSCGMCILDPVWFVNLAEDIEDSDKEAFFEVVDATVGHYKIK